MRKHLHSLTEQSGLHTTSFDVKIQTAGNAGDGRRSGAHLRQCHYPKDPTNIKQKERGQKFLGGSTKQKGVRERTSLLMIMSFTQPLLPPWYVRMKPNALMGIATMACNSDRFRGRADGTCCASKRGSQGCFALDSDLAGHCSTSAKSQCRKRPSINSYSCVTQRRRMYQWLMKYSTPPLGQRTFRSATLTRAVIPKSPPFSRHLC